MSRRIVQDQLSLMNVDFINNNMTKMTVENSINNINGDSGSRLRADGDTAVDIESFHEVSYLPFHAVHFTNSYYLCLKHTLDNSILLHVSMT